MEHVEYLTRTHCAKYNAYAGEQYLHTTLGDAWDACQEHVSDTDGEFTIHKLDHKFGTITDVTADAIAEFRAADEDLPPVQHRLGAEQLGVGRFA